MEPDDDQDLPEELVPVENPAAEDPLLQQASGQSLPPFPSAPFAPTTGARPPTPARFLAPLSSPHFAPRGMGMLPPVRPPLHVNPVLAGPENAAADDPNPNQDPLVQETLLVSFQSPPFTPSDGKLSFVRPPLPATINDVSAGDYHLAPFESPAFAPRGPGKLHGVRPPVYIDVEAPVFDGGDVFDVDAAPPVQVDAAVDLDPGLPPNDVVYPERVAGEADASNDVVQPNDDSPAFLHDVVSPQVPGLLRRLYQFLMLSMDDSDVASAIAWIDDFTFTVLNPQATANYLGVDRRQLGLELEQYGMVQIVDDEWRHSQGYLHRGTPEMLQQIQAHQGPQFQVTKE